MQERHIVYMFCHIRHHGRDPFSRLSCGNELPGRFHQVSVFPLKCDFRVSWQRGAVKFFQCRFVVPEIDMGRGTRTKDLKDLLCFRDICCRFKLSDPISGCNFGQGDTCHTATHRS